MLAEVAGRADRAAAVYVGLLPVADLVAAACREAGARFALSRKTEATLTITVAVADLAIAALRAVRAAAIDIRFVLVSVPVMAVVADRMDAVEEDAIAGREAVSALGAGHTNRPAAVGIGLHSIDLAIVASDRKACEVNTQLAGAVGVDHAVQTSSARRTVRAAAVDVGLEAVTDPVGAG